MLKHLLRPLATRCPSRLHVLRIQALSGLPSEQQPLAGITSKFDDTEVNKILQVINCNKSVSDLLEFDISKGRAQKIRSWLNKNGPFKSVDQLLELDGFGFKNLEQFCGSIVNGETSGHRLRKTIARSQQFTTPIVTADMRSRMQSCTAIHIGITSISWAQFQLEANEATSLVDWSFNTIPEKKLHISEFVQSVMEINERIPESDAYVFETPRVAHQGPQGTPATINISVQMSQMAAMTAMAMAQRHIAQDQIPPDNESATTSNSQHSSQVLFMRQFLASRLFHTVVGMERISTATVVGSLMQDSANLKYKQPQNRPIAGEIVINSRLQQMYASGDGHSKEFLGQSLLMGLSFLRLCVLQCPHSLELLKTRGRQN